MAPLPDNLIRTAAFSLYVLWLVAFPMSGPLLEGHGDMAWFLWPHIAALLLCARCRPGTFAPLLRGGTLSSALTTLFWIPLDNTYANLVLAVAGIASAPTSIYMGLLLKGGRQPVLLAALGLACGNLLLVSLGYLPFSAHVQLALLAGALPGLLLAPPPRTGYMLGPTPGLYRYLPFVVCFQLVSGLMYGHMLPVYGEVGVLPGSELLFYAASAVAVAGLSVRNRETTLFIGVFVAMLAYAIWHFLPSPLAEHAGMFTMMMAAGIIDVFLLAYALSYTNVLRAYGHAVAALVGGIAGGYHLSASIGPANQTVSLFALILLNLAVLAMLAVQRSHAASVVLPAFPETPLPETLPLEMPPPPSGLPTALAELLSEQERQVLLSMLRHRTYKEVAAELQISESSVKTYIQRVYRKTGVFRRSQLLGLIRGEVPLPATSKSQWPPSLS